jgi:hypothetical protein
LQGGTGCLYGTKAELPLSILDAAGKAAGPRTCSDAPIHPAEGKHDRHAFEAMMGMTRIDIAAIEAARRAT